jgi:short-subunit dehydrogenase
MNAPRKIMLITGASGGIGADLARVAAEKGHDLALVARNRAALDALADEIAGQTGRTAPRPLVFDCDLSQEGAAGAIAAFVEQSGADVEILVNNAGFGVVDAALDGDIAEQLGMIDLNIRALTELSLRFGGRLAANRGRLLNVASVAAFMPGPGMAVYYASKAYVLSFSEALSAELAPFGVSVTALCPGPVPTGFQARAGFGGAMNAVRHIALSSPQVARAGYDGMMAGKRVVLPGLTAKIMAWSAPFTPKGLSLKLVASLQMRRKWKEAARK